MNDRRHELQQNDLAIYLGRINHAIEPYSKLIAVLVGGLMVAALAWMLYSSKQTGDRSDATLNLLEAMSSQDTEVLEAVSQDFPGTIAGSWARLYQANEFLSQGVSSLFADRDNATVLLGDAKDAFNVALAGSTDPLLRSRAHLGLARAAESLGELDEAIAEYKEVISIAESDAMVAKAEERIATLSKPSTKNFLAWFADQDFSPADPSLPPALPGSESLPDIPDLELPSLDLPGGENSDVMDLDSGLQLPAEEGAEDMPAETPATETPPTETPATETPPTETPATDSPATETATEPATEGSATGETVETEAVKVDGDGGK